VTLSDELGALAREFWAWRAVTQPSSGDDIPRIERPVGWVPDWSSAAVETRREVLAGFDTRWQALGAEARTLAVALQVDYRLVGSALARVHWELDTLQNWRRSPQFYVYQTLGAVFEALLEPPPFDTVRSEAIVARTEQIPATLEAARANLLGHAVQPFARLAITALEDIAPRLQTVVSHLGPLLAPRGVDTSQAAVGPHTPSQPEAQTRPLLQTRGSTCGQSPPGPQTQDNPRDPRGPHGHSESDSPPRGDVISERFRGAVARASVALDDFREWLLADVEAMPTETAIGRTAYVGFLRDVALVPLSPEQIVAAGRQELERAVAFETLEVQRNRHVPPLTLPATQAEQIAREAADERMLRQFCEQHDLLSFPDRLNRYRYLPLPAYLEPLRHLGVTDDLTSPTRLTQAATCYIPEPAPDLAYFYLAMARDPRTLIAHEGMHYYQLARSWLNPDPIRRHYYDSGPNEGIGFYAEEMLLQAGLFDDSPHSREIIYSFMRLRALRVDVDVRLALGELSIDTAAAELEQRVPMDAATAREEASFFASDPGQAITYQVGKLQLLSFLADARLALGQNFNVRVFHDSVWVNGNVPIAMQRWESLGLRDEVDLLDTAT
jgi:hypothetical protein